MQPNHALKKCLQQILHSNIYIECTVEEKKNLKSRFWSSFVTHCVLWRDLGALPAASQ